MLTAYPCEQCEYWAIKAIAIKTSNHRATSGVCLVTIFHQKAFSAFTQPLFIAFSMIFCWSFTIKSKRGLLFVFQYHRWKWEAMSVALRRFMCLAFVRVQIRKQCNYIFYLFQRFVNYITVMESDYFFRFSRLFEWILWILFHLVAMKLFLFTQRNQSTANKSHSIQGEYIF